METSTFENINSIQKVQFLTDTTGYLLDNNGELSSFVGNKTELINTPENINISNFHFITESQGAIIGHSTKKIQEASMFEISAILIVSLLIFAIIRKVSKKFYPKKFLSISFFAFLLISFTVSCNNDWKEFVEQDPNSSFTTIIKKVLLGNGFHNFGGNTGQKSFFSKTTNAGIDWSSQELPTNFDLTSIISIGKNYFVGSFADKDHSDGDLWIFGNDSTYCKLLARNKNNDPYFFSANRGINGLKYYKKDSTLIIYGGEVISKFPKNQNSATEGNITELKADIFSDYRIIDVPENVVVNSYAKMNNRNVYITLENDKLLQTDGKKWNEITINNQTEFKQVEFIPETEIGYTLSVEGIVYKTINNGNDWNRIDISGIEKMELFESTIIFIKKNMIIKQKKRLANKQ